MWAINTVKPPSSDLTRNFTLVNQNRVKIDLCIFRIVYNYIWCVDSLTGLLQEVFTHWTSFLLFLDYQLKVDQCDEIEASKGSFDTHHHALYTFILFNTAMCVCTCVHIKYDSVHIIITSNSDLMVLIYKIISLFFDWYTCNLVVGVAQVVDWVIHGIWFWSPAPLIHVLKHPWAKHWISDGDICNVLCPTQV